MVTERRFDTGLVSLNYAEGLAAGQPMVLLHGVTLHWQTFWPVIPLLGWRWHIYALDFRGHGRSGHAAGAYCAADYASDTIRFLREVVREPAVLIGHSLGGAVAVQVAAEAPDAVGAVVLADPLLYGRPFLTLAGGTYYARFVAYRELARSRRSLTELIAALALLPLGMDRAALRARAATLRQMDPDLLTRILDDSAFDAYDDDAVLAGMACPVLLLQADPGAGGVLSDERAERAAARLADCTLVRLPGMGHGFHSVQPLAFAQMVLNFLESL